MPTDDILLDCEEKMEKAVEFFRQELRGIRTGRASSGLVEHVKVDYYGSPTELRQLASIAVPEPDLIVIKPFDPTSIKDIERAIQTSDLGITPNSDGKLIRLAIPPLSEERRKQLAAQVRASGEQAKVAVRNVRREANREIDKLKEDKAISEDAAYNTKDEIQELTKESEKKVDDLVARKSEEIMKF